MKKWIVGYFVIIFTVLGINLYIHKDKVSAAREIIVPGTVVDYVTRQSRDSKGHHHTTYAEVISFTLNGKEYRFTRGTSFGWTPKIGRVRELAVDPAQPRTARVRMSSWLEKLVPEPIKQFPALIILWLMGCGFFGVCWFMYGYSYEFFRRAIIVPGSVTSYDTQIGHKGGTSYVEIVSYEFDGQTRTVRGIIGMPYKPKIGTRRDVGIDPQNPLRVRIRSGSWFAPVFGIIGLLLWALMLVADKFQSV